MQQSGFGIGKGIQGGMVKLCDGLAAKFKQNGGTLQCSTPVNQIRRTAANVFVHYGTEKAVFDEVILSTTPDITLKYLDASEEERALFTQTQYIRYAATVCTVTGMKEWDKAGPRVVLDQLRSDLKGHLLTFVFMYPETDVCVACKPALCVLLLSFLIDLVAIRCTP
jgi:hypothetical protein